MSSREAGLLLLRYGLAIMFLWFGFSQLFDGVNWVGWVPDWAISIIPIPPAMIVLLNGLFEVVLGSMLALGILVRPAAILLGLHLIVITIELGVTQIGMRDFGLTAATFALALVSGKKENHI